MLAFKILSKPKSILKIKDLVSKFKLKLFSNIVFKYALFATNLAIIFIFILIKLFVSLFLALVISQASNKLFAMSLDIAMRELSLKLSCF